MDNYGEQVRKEYAGMTRVYMGMLVAMVCAVAGIIVYYEQRIKSMCGIVYRNDESVFRQLIAGLITGDGMSEGYKVAEEAIKQGGYTENGWNYLFSKTSSWMIIVLLVLLIAGLVLGVFKIYMRHSQSVAMRAVELWNENLELQDKLAVNVEYVKRRNRQLQDFVENVCHQIKTPLTGLTLFLENKQQEEECDNSEEAFYFIERIKKLINILLKISRMESGKVIMTREKVAVRQIIQASVKLSGIDECMVEIVGEDDEAVTYADEDWFAECLVNILTNCEESLKNVEQGRIRIEYQQNSANTIINISDNGPGLVKGEEDKIFDRFESKRSVNSVHVGIGLNLSQLIVKEHYGSIAAGRCEELGGANFRITLPRYDVKAGKVASI